MKKIIGFTNLTRVNWWLRAIWLVLITTKSLSPIRFTRLIIIYSATDRGLSVIACCVMVHTDENCTEKHVDFRRLYLAQQKYQRLFERLSVRILPTCVITITGTNSPGAQSVWTSEKLRVVKIAKSSTRSTFTLHLVQILILSGRIKP